MAIKQFIFDLDGTLWDTSTVSADAYNHALRKDGRCDLVVTAQIIKNEFGKAFRDIADDLFPGFALPVRDELMQLCAITNNQFLADTDCLMLYPDVPGTLEALSQKAPLYMVSNCESGYMEMFLQKYSLEAYITDMECLGNNGNSKADNIRLIVERNHLDHAVYVGDTAGDCDSAEKAGVPFIFASYGFGTVAKECLSIKHFSDLLEYV